MRTALIFLPLALSACNVANEPERDQVTVTYDEERIRKTADTTKRTAKEVGAGVVNVTKGTAEVIKKEVGDVDVDVKVTRTKEEEKAAQ